MRSNWLNTLKSSWTIWIDPGYESSPTTTEGVANSHHVADQGLFYPGYFKMHTYLEIDDGDSN